MSYQSIKKAVEVKCKELKRDVPLIIAVSKGQPIEKILKAYHEGCRDFGENRLQELEEKKVQLPSDIRWHLIGPVQSKKVNKVVGANYLIHSVDTPQLAKLISSKGVPTQCLLQANTSGEKSKSGASFDEWVKAWDEVKNLPGLKILGLMTIAPLTDDPEMIRKTFKKLKELGEKLSLKELSMGMSQDWMFALENGATMLRIGSALFQNM